MKRTIFIVALFIFGFSALAFAQNNQVTLTTYYPAPFGMYQEMRVMGYLGVGSSYPGVQGSFKAKAYIVDPNTNTDPNADGLLVAGNSGTIAKNHSIAFGRDVKATGYYSTAAGMNTQAISDYSVALGFNTVAAGLAATALGFGTGTTGATGDYSTVMGYKTEASGLYSLAAGNSSVASGQNSVAIGEKTVASGDNSFAIGLSNTGFGASGAASTAMGGYTTASGSFSTAMGQSTIASGGQATALGGNTTASGSNSVAMGVSTTASGANSVAMGISTNAQSYGSLVIGVNNVASGTPDSWVQTDPIFVIGNGFMGTPSNLITVLKNGKFGIKTANPLGILHIKESVDNNLLVRGPLGLPTGVSLYAVNDANSLTRGMEFASSQFYFNNGYVGIWTTSPQQALDVNGSGRFRNSVIIQSSGSTAIVNGAACPTQGEIIYRAGSFYGCSSTGWHAL